MTSINPPDALYPHFAILLILSEEAESAKAASTITAALRPECEDRVTCLQPPVRGAEFLRQHQTDALDDWWPLHVREGARLVYLVDDEPGLSATIAGQPGMFFIATPSATSVSIHLFTTGEIAVVKVHPDALVATFLSQYAENDEGFGPGLFRREIIDELQERASADSNERHAAAQGDAEEEELGDQDTTSSQRAAPRPDPAAPLEEWSNSRIHELDELGASNFTHAVTSGAVAVALGYERLVRSVTDHLRAKRSVLLVGPAQVGKTAIIAAAAQALYDNRAMDTRESGSPRLIASLTTSDLLADGNKLGEWEKNLGHVVGVARDTGCVLYFEDFWFLHEAGRSRDYSSNFSEYMR